jgi:hypothetical protein
MPCQSRVANMLDERSALATAIQPQTEEEHRTDAEHVHQDLNHQIVSLKPKFEPPKERQDASD